MELRRQNNINLPHDVDKSKLIKIASAKISFNLSEIWSSDGEDEEEKSKQRGKFFASFSPLVRLLACCVMESKPLYISFKSF